MSNDKTVTEREAVLRERKAAEDAFLAGTHTTFSCSGAARDYARQWAVDAHPLPKVTRPRVVRDPHDMNGRWAWYPTLNEFAYAHPEISDGDFYGPAVYGPIPVTSERVRIWADLLANPTEDVEDES
jgi:hypothetical protein